MKNKTAQTQFTKMKRIKNFTLEILGATILSAGLYACSNDNEAKMSNTEYAKPSVETTFQAKNVSGDLISFMTIRESISDAPYKIFNVYGIDKIEVFNSEETLEYTLLSHSEIFFGYKGKALQLNNKKLIVKRDRMYIDGINNVFIQYVGGEFLVKEEGLTFNLDTVTQDELEMIKPESALLIELLGDFTTTYGDGPKHNRPCQGSKIYTETSFGMTQAAAGSSLEHAIEEMQGSGKLDGCTKLHTTPEYNSIAWGFIHSAAISFCCDGKGGAGGSW